MLCHIQIRNDYDFRDVRQIFVYYADHVRNFRKYIGEETRECSRKQYEEFLQTHRLWIDEWERRRNGDLFAWFEVSDIDNENWQRAYDRIIGAGLLKGADEHSDIEEEYFFENEPKPQLPVLYHPRTTNPTSGTVGLFWPRNMVSCFLHTFLLECR